MKCSSCGVEIDKQFKMALQKNQCPACGKVILPSGNLSAFVPLCELLSGFKTVHTEGGEMYDDDVEALATLIISSFNVRLKSDKEEVVAEVQTAKDDPDAEHKQKQMADAKAILQKMRDEAYNDAIKAQWGMTPDGEEPLDPDIGEALANQVGSGAPDVGQSLVEQKQRAAYQNMVKGSGKVKRG